MKVVQMPRILRRTLLELLRGLLRMLVFLSLAYLVLELFSPGYQSEFHPFYRFFLFIRDIATFRLGENADGVPLAFFMSRGITRSLLVFVPSIFAASLISYALVRRDCISNPSRLHRILHGANGVTSAIPVYWLALLFFLLSTRISWLPLGGVTDVNHSDLTAPGKLLDYARHLILPWASLFTFSTFAITGALERRMDGIMGSRFVLLARTQGYSGRRLFRTHLRPSLISELFLQLSAQMPVFVTILIFTELVFRYTGLGYYLLYPYKFSWGRNRRHRRKPGCPGVPGDHRGTLPGCGLNGGCMAFAVSRRRRTGGRGDAGAKQHPAILIGPICDPPGMDWGNTALCRSVFAPRRNRPNMARRCRISASNGQHDIDHEWVSVAGLFTGSPAGGASDI
jgi:ABC-type dipeptide/oligopeptide/nickel transport system permease component